MSGTVTCRTHNTQRLAKYCVSVPVKNADGDVLRSSWQCLPEYECESFSSRMGAPTGSGGKGDATADGEGEKSAASRLYGQSGRYYDLSKYTGGIDSTQKKVCFACGLTDHEKPNCPSVLCRSCHQCFGDPEAPKSGSHQCPDLPLSPFVALAALSAEDLKDVRCTLCHQTGHLDCAGMTNPPGFVPMCSYCGSAGHHAFNCRMAPADRWHQYMDQKAGRSVPPQQGSGGPPPPPSNQYRPTTSGGYGGGGYGGGGTGERHQHGGGGSGYYGGWHQPPPSAAPRSYGSGGSDYDGYRHGGGSQHQQRPAGNDSYDSHHRHRPRDDDSGYSGGGGGRRRESDDGYRHRPHDGDANRGGNWGGSSDRRRFN